MLDVITWPCGTVKSLNNAFNVPVPQSKVKRKRKPRSTVIKTVSARAAAVLRENANASDGFARRIKDRT